MTLFTDGVVPWNSLDDNTRAPLTSELESGYPCGPADQELFNWTAGWPIGNIWNMILQGGFTPDTDKLLDLARAIQSGKINYAVATGTANAWTVAPSLAVPAYAAGRVLWIIAPATNTSTTVNANVSGLGNRRIKKGDGTDPAVGDLISGRAYATIDDGTNIRVLSPLPSEIAAMAGGAVPSNIVKFSSGGTYTKPSNLIAVQVTLVGGGASGGVSSSGFVGGGGGSGSTIEAYFKASDLNATETVVVGSGGAAVSLSAVANGNNAGNSSFKNMIAGGGQGGTGASGANGTSGTAGAPTVAGPGVGVDFSGAPGPNGIRVSAYSVYGIIGSGGSGGTVGSFGGGGGSPGVCIIREYLK